MNITEKLNKTELSVKMNNNLNKKPIKLGFLLIIIKICFKKKLMKIGISSIHFDVPKIYLPIEDLAKERAIEPAKLEKGLGLQRMSFPDVHQDVVCFAANAVIKLMETENLKPSQIDRIYVGTESALDSSKPLASFLLPILAEKFGDENPHCDVVDLTFACIGGVDALQNCLDYVRLRPEKKCLVVCSDFAKYDLSSTGEYTQGAGAVAMLIEAHPKLLSFPLEAGVSSRGAFDFFKPKRSFQKRQILNSNVAADHFSHYEEELLVAREQPVFDGQYSNQSYLERVKEAYYDFKKQKASNTPCYKNWSLILMHLPYCFQARRMFWQLIAEEQPELNSSFQGTTEADKWKAFSKSEAYKKIVQEKIYPAEIASGKVGNIYTGSLFLGLLSALYFSAKENQNLSKHTLGFMAYGSGAKAKVFEAEVEAEWKVQILKTNLFETLAKAQAISFETYKDLYLKRTNKSVLPVKNEVYLKRVEKENSTTYGARFYAIAN